MPSGVLGTWPSALCGPLGLLFLRPLWIPHSLFPCWSCHQEYSVKIFYLKQARCDGLLLGPAVPVSSLGLLVPWPFSVSSSTPGPFQFQDKLGGLSKLPNACQLEQGPFKVFAGTKVRICLDAMHLNHNPPSLTASPADTTPSKLDLSGIRKKDWFLIRPY